MAIALTKKDNAININEDLQYTIACWFMSDLYYEITHANYDNGVTFSPL